MMSEITHTEPPIVDLELHRQTLAEEIRKYAAAARSGRLAHARFLQAVQCGYALLQLKRNLPHGDFEQWLEQRCGLTRATANRYMRLSRRASELPRCTTIREAYLAAGVIRPKQPRPVSPPPQ